jgi:hypothetical protein
MKPREEEILANGRNDEPEIARVEVTNEPSSLSAVREIGVIRHGPSVTFNGDGPVATVTCRRRIPRRGARNDINGKGKTYYSLWRR